MSHTLPRVIDALLQAKAEVDKADDSPLRTHLQQKISEAIRFAEIWKNAAARASSEVNQEFAVKEH